MTIYWLKLISLDLDRSHDIDAGRHSSQRRLIFGGDAVALTEDLASCANGGQVVLSEAAWSSVQEQLPGACQVAVPCQAPLAISEERTSCGHIFASCRCFSKLSQSPIGLTA